MFKPLTHQIAAPASLHVIHNDVRMLLCFVLSAGAYADAINLYEQALSHAPSDVRLYNNCAIAKLYLEK